MNAVTDISRIKDATHITYALGRTTIEVSVFPCCGKVAVDFTTPGGQFQTNHSLPLDAIGPLCEALAVAREAARKGSEDIARVREEEAKVEREEMEGTLSRCREQVAGNGGAS